MGPRHRILHHLVRRLAAWAHNVCVSLSDTQANTLTMCVRVCLGWRMRVVCVCVVDTCLFVCDVCVCMCALADAFRFVWVLLVLFAPIAWPISKILDLVLGEHGATFYRRSELKVRQHNTTHTTQKPYACVQKLDRYAQTRETQTHTHETHTHTCPTS